MAGARPATTAIPLGRPSPGASCNQPERQGQRTGLAPPQGGADVAPIRFCSRRGLPCRRRCRRRGALLPHPFTLAVAPALTAKPTAVCFLWRYPWGRPRRTLSGAASAWSPDFPPPRRKGGGRPADWRYGAYEGQTAAVKENRLRSKNGHPGPVECGSRRVQQAAPIRVAALPAPPSREWNSIPRT